MKFESYVVGSKIWLNYVKSHGRLELKNTALLSGIFSVFGMHPIWWTISGCRSDCHGVSVESYADAERNIEVGC